MIAYIQKHILIYSLIIIVIMGFLLTISIYPRIIDPHYDNWLLSGDTDIVQPYTAWLLYKNSDWVFPFATIARYGFPVATTISFSDSIPLFAIPFKIIRNFLTHTFQYIGLWIVFCVMMQGVFGFLFVYKMNRRHSIAIVVACLFMLSPVMWFRLGGHFALGGQWILLWGLYLLFLHKNFMWKQWIVVLCISILIHPYFVFMNIMICMIDMISVWRLKKMSTVFFGVYSGIYFFILLIMSYILGLFSISSVSASGFGEFSVNLNSFVNPQGWSLFLPSFALVNNFQMEGFAYMGLGILFLLLCAGIYGIWYVYITRHIYTKKWFVDFFSMYWPYIGGFVCILFIAMGFRMSIGSHILFIIPHPTIFDSLFSIVRSSGRFVWIIYYALIFAIVYILNRIPYKLFLMILLCAVFLQIIDIAPTLYKRGDVFVSSYWETTLHDSFWSTAFDKYDHIMFLPRTPLDSYMDFIYASQDSDIIFDNVLTARMANENEWYIQKQIDFIKQNIVQQDTLYVMTTYDRDFISSLDEKQVSLKKIDGYIVIAP